MHNRLSSILLIFAIIFCALPLHPAQAQDELIPSLKDVFRMKITDSTRVFKDVSCMTMNFTFCLNGSIVIRDWYESLNFSIPLASTTLELWANSSHVAYSYSRSGLSLWLYFDFAKFPSKVKITFSGNVAAKLNVPLRFDLQNSLFDVGKQVLWSKHDLDVKECGLGFSLDGSSAIFDSAAKTLTYQVQNSFSVDPSIITNSTTTSALQYGYQHKTFYNTNNSKHYVILVVNGSIFPYYSSDGISWTKNAANLYGSGFGYFCDYAYVNGSNYFLQADCSGTGIPHLNKYAMATEGTVSFANQSDLAPGSIRSWLGIYELDEVTSLYGDVISGNRFQMRYLDFGSTNYTTKITIPAATAANHYRFFTPFTTNTTDLTSEPTIQYSGWNYQFTKFTIDKKGYVSYYIRNPTTAMFTGLLGVRLWKSSNPTTFIGATAMTAWTYSSTISFSGTLNQIKTGTIAWTFTYPSTTGSQAYFLNNESMLIEFMWKLTTTNATVAMAVELGTKNPSATTLNWQVSYSRFPSISIDDQNYPCVTFISDVGQGVVSSAWKPIYVKCSSNQGWCDLWSNNVTMLHDYTGGDAYGYTDPDGLRCMVQAENGTRVMAMYGTNVDIYGSWYSLLQNAYSWGTEHTITSNVGASYYVASASINNSCYFTWQNYDYVNYTWQISYYREDLASWATPSVASSSINDTTSPVLGVRLSTNQICLFYEGNGTSKGSNRIFYVIMTNSNKSLSSSMEWIDESSGTLQYDRISCTAFSFGEKLGLAYSKLNTGTLYDIKYAFFDWYVPPVTRTWHDLYWNLYPNTRAWTNNYWILIVNSRGWTQNYFIINPNARGWTDLLEWMQPGSRSWLDNPTVLILSLSDAPYIIPLLFLAVIVGGIMILTYRKKQ